MGRLPPTVRLVGLGWYVALSIALGIGGGVLLDTWLGTRPALTLAGLFLGLTVAFWGSYRMLNEALRPKRPEDDTEGK
ncbi:hypothetical protein HRbin25_00697 [bacterium HR25]|jgi:F0F1-type ATP synthase assembly protein I|nr:hypothetical protein HRbin25_00697 [bacterium HR25]